MPTNLLTPAFWLTIYPPNLNFWSAIVFLAISFGMLVAGVVLAFFANKNQKKDRYNAAGKFKLVNWLVLWSLVLLFWTFFAYERINLFGAPFWLILIFAGAIIWMVFIILYFKKTLPAIRKQEAEKIAKQKYLPKRKKR